MAKKTLQTAIRLMAVTMALAVAGTSTVSAAQPTMAASCESIAGLTLPNVTITMAKPVAAGGFASPPGTAVTAGATGQQGGGATPADYIAVYRSLPAFCRVAATLKPSKDSDIKIEVWMPASGWNGKLESLGNGAWAGTIGYGDLATAVTAGYAAASTDTGHSGFSARFVAGHPEKLVDFAYRAVHEMTVASKAIIAAYFGNAPKFSYFNGCSTGGRQALAEAQRYPLDYDGIIAGDPANDATHLHAQQIWNAVLVHQDEAGFIPSFKFAFIHEAVLRQCDALDGVPDGVIENPKVCRFDPKVLACTDGDGPSCLTSPQLQTVQKAFAGLTNPRTGKQIFPGVEPGSELEWGGGAGMLGAQPISLAIDMYKYIVHKDANWDYLKFDPATDVDLADKVMAGTMNSNDADLRPFFQHGGKLLMYHGWSDPGIAPGSSVDYYKNVLDKVGGAAKASNSIRLFMVPGMNHCSGGDGTDTFDKIAALDNWKESDKAPDSISASHKKNGAVDRTRPLCPYPQVAAYKGAGSTNDAANFACKAP